MTAAAARPAARRSTFTRLPRPSRRRASPAPRFADALPVGDGPDGRDDGRRHAPRGARLELPWRWGSRACSTTARAGPPATPPSSPPTGTWSWRSGRWLSGTLTLMMMNSLEPATFDGRRHAADLPDRRDLRGPPAGGPPAPARPVHEPVRHLAAPDRPTGAAWVQAGAGGRARARPDRVHAPRVVGGEPGRAPRPPLAGLVAHHEHRDHGRRRLAALRARGVRVPRQGARRRTLGHRRRRAWTRSPRGSRCASAAAGRARCSHAFLHDPETLSPGDARRTTASLHYGAAGDRPLAASAIWGQNREVHGVSDAVLAEAAWQLTRPRPDLRARGVRRRRNRSC